MQQAIEDLRWLGFDWDEGPDCGGPNAPYIQTERTSFYREALKALIDRDQVIPCTCTRADIAIAASAPHLGHEGPIYPGACRAWRKGKPLPEPESFAWRFRCDEGLDEFDDLLRGCQRCILMQELGDFPVTRKGGDAAYQLAVVVDDALMEINQVVRGDDLLPSAFRQRMLQRKLMLPYPSQAHLPLVVGADGRRLAKRHGDTRLAHYRQQGVKSESIIGLLAWSLGFIEKQEAVSPCELQAEFGFEKLRKEVFVVTEEHERWLTSGTRVR
jgi:glutamyl-tRNA synthetase